jgi:hypothetical protein
LTPAEFPSGRRVTLAVGHCVGSATLAAQQGEAQMHPRIVKAIDAIKDARAYLQEAPWDFGGHKVAAMKACDDAIKQLREALEYRAEQDHRR